MIKHIMLLAAVGFCTMFMPLTASASDTKDNLYKTRMSLYKKTEAVTQVPWYLLAAMDQYERNTLENNADPVVSIQIPDELWYGAGNIMKLKNQEAISLFHGKGLDATGDGKANPQSPEDVLFTVANMLLEEGHGEEDFKIGLWKYYRRDLSVQTISNTARVFQKFQRLDLNDRAFPVSTKFNYSYRSTWGDARGFGGRRIHEGTDIFAGYGVPAISSTYGVVELKGWNRFGGWRVGIRDIHNIYHYYAHLQSFSNIKVGQIVKPGDVLGTVGSTGYGPPGTSGKFPPHLHYGMYKDNGSREWSFDPYPFLRKWERLDNN